MGLSRQIREHRSLVLLLVLVGLSFTSLVTGTEATLVHRTAKRAIALTAYPFLSAKSSFASGVDGAFDFVFGFAALRQENTTLRRRLVQMRKNVSDRYELDEENARLRGMLGYVRGENRLDLEPVRVIERLKGMITIDRGAVHGIQTSMGVIAEGGVVGVITEVADLTSKVATLHHADCRIGAMVLRNRLRAYDGVLHASTSDWRFICTMDYIDMKDEVRLGDKVVTSPESVFPAGYPIGTVSAPPHGSGSLWKWAEVSPSVDPYRLDEVFVIRRATQSAGELSGPPLIAAIPLGATLRAETAPDERPIQERYAP